MKPINYLVLPIFLVLFASCEQEPTPETQQEEVKSVRRQAQELEETVDEMKPQIDAEAQKTIDQVEKRIQEERSP